MRHKLNILRGRPWLLLCPLFAWLLPQNAVADDGYETFVDQSYLYNVFVSGTNTVTITVPCYDQEGADAWIEDATLYASWEGQSELHLLDWGVGGSSISNDQSSCPVTFATQAPGQLRIFSGSNTTSFYTVKPNEGSKKYNIVRNDDGCTFNANVIWVFPKELLGKTVTLRWHVLRNGTGRKRVYLDEVGGLKQPDPIKLPDANATTPPFISLSVPSNDSKGKIEVPWTLVPDKIEKLRYEYNDANNRVVSVDMPTTTNNGAIKLNAYEPHHNFRIIADYYEAQTIGEYLITDVASEPQDLTMIHAPHGLTVTPLGGATPKVEVKWNIGNISDEDISDIDFFEIQRSLTGKEEDFVSIGQVPFARIGSTAKSVYTYVDSTFVEAIAEPMLTDGYNLETLTYRVRRAMTQNWGWEGNPCASTAKCVLDNLHLLRFADYSAKLEDESYNVRVSWKYADEPGGVWDDRAKMKIHITSTNLAGDVVEEKDVELNQEDRELCYKVINLSRPCLKYDVKLYIDRDKSPLNLYNEEKMKDYYFPIRTYDDWISFADKVEKAKGQYDVNARLYTDIDTYKSIGYESFPFRGTFDGNGHTLTYTAPHADSKYSAPFCYVGNATIKNLHVAGTIKTEEQYAGGLIAYIINGSDVTIENCHSSVIINSTNYTNGGFVSRLGDNSKLVIRNCKFDGSFEGEKSHHNGGFIGYCQDKSTAIIDNCLFSPDHINTGIESCETWARGGDFSLTVMNSYATMQYSSALTIRNASDWHKFAVMVNDAVNKSDVNAVLDADITISEHVGVTEGAMYRGTFDGNGHTITFNKNWTESERFIALFRHVGNATIKNLHVAGTVTSSQMYPAGIVAQVKDGTATIENCQSSVTLKGTMNGEGTLAGFVGRVTDSNVTIRNCKFDGSFEGANSTGNGGFISWVDEGSKATIENCLFAPTAINTKLEKCETWARKDSRGTVTVTNSHATKEYSEYDLRTIDGKTFMVLRSEADWTKFKWAIKDDNFTNAIMDADFTVNDCVAWDGEGTFSGIFDGNGHTLTVNIDNGASPYAVFKNGQGCTIKNLHVKGTVKGGNHAAALVGTAGQVNGKWTNINNCRVSASVISSDWLAGGFVGRGTHANIQNCRFDGSIQCQKAQTGGSQNWAGAFFGFRDGERDATVTDAAVKNCLEQASWNNITHQHLNEKPWTYWGNGENDDTRNNWSYTGVSGATSTAGLTLAQLVEKLGSSNWEESGGIAVPKMFKTTISDNPWATMSASEMVNILGKDNWEVVDGKAVPKMRTASAATSDGDGLANLGTWTKDGDTVIPTTTTVTETTVTINTPTLPDFYHTSTGKIDKELLTETRQSSVVLTWNSDGNPIDYFVVMRREAGQGENDWEDISPKLDQMTYEDNTVSPLKQYQYKVRAAADCEGEHYTYTDVSDGACKNTGRLEGYVRFNDGTGIPDVTINVSGGSIQTSATTDASGHYVVDELPYQGRTNITYEVTAGSGIEAEVKTYAVTFDSKTNDVTVHEITATNGKRFSGTVIYEGTTIPVKGANFLLNGKKLHNAAGQYVETDEEGQFSFRVLPTNNTIQVVMDDHWFVNDGKYSKHFTTDVAGIQFQDGTKVKLIGRIVGGTDQGKLPLGNSLSKNNLGDNLQMVLALEGDSKSWLVYDNLNRERTERTDTYKHKGDGDHKTTVKTLRKRMEVTPDQATGEFELLLPPVRWKVQQVYCQGYSTLFQEGQASEVIDLTDCLTPKDTTYVGTFTNVDGNSVYNPTASYNAIYNRIYRTQVKLTYKQLTYDSFDYFGDKNYSANQTNGSKVQMPLAYKGADGQATYTFGFPVFSLERRYYIQVQAGESYPYNNDLASGKIDFVSIGGGLATMHNGFKNGVVKDTLSLDANGQAVFMLQADQVAQPVGYDNALRTVTFSVEQNGTNFEAAPLYGYILNLYPIGKGKELLTEGQPLLFDILRDPPGAYSSTTLAKGATLNNSYAMNLSLSGGVIFNFSLADKLTWFDGYTFGNMYELSGTLDADFDGVQHSAEKVDISYTDLVFNFNGSKAWSHTMALSNAVSTSGDPSMVGADADLYIGMVQNVQVKPLSSISVITDSAYQARIAASGLGQANTGDVAQYAKYGTLVNIAEGMDADGNKYHLVRDVSLGYGPKLKSQFIYSQKQILEEIIPAKVNEILALMFIGTQEEAKRAANQSGKAVYRSLRPKEDPKFGYRNKEYNTTKMTADEHTHYVIVLPDNKTSGECPDEIAEKSEIIYAWTKMITQNEREKLNATDLVASYDIAGAQGINYSETFSSSYSNATSMYFPYGVQPDYFDAKGSGVGMSVASLAVNYILGGVFGYLESLKKLDPEVSGGVREKESTLNFDGVYFRWSLTPVLSSTTIGTNSFANEYNRSESFTIAAAPTSRLAVDVYRVPMVDVTKIYGKYKPEDVFSNYNFTQLNDTTLAYLRNEGNVPDRAEPCSFVFRTRGGYTSNPWEDERKTHFYNAGSLLDERTLKIDNPKISLDKHSVSGVSINDPARFTIYLTNESEKPEATLGLSVMQLFAADQSNPNGARISVNGQTLTTGGMTVSLVPGVTTQLEMEVRAGKGFDYEGLTIGLMSPGDAEHAIATTSFDVHFLREAGAVSISIPTDKWVLNTNAQQDPKRGWYIPVTISDFDRHQHNFDHIEFQYKETQRGDDAWVNLCSFYADSTLMANANGVCKMIEPNGNIVTEFFGEGWTIERSYDLRAVLFCRNGSTFLTTPSKVISGVKDTRRPQLFGIPEPKSGLLTLEDDIVFNFSEDIEYNNLSAISNFEVKGEVNNDNLSEAVSLQFTNKVSVETEAKRNFTDKDLTIDMRIKPDETGREMPLFSHGTSKKKLQLWLTSDFKLKAVVNNQTYTSTASIEKDVFSHVGLVINQQDSTLMLYCNDKVVGGKYKLSAPYSSTGPLIFGRTNELDRTGSTYYEGRMMEARLWYSALTIGQFDTYGLRRLTGYEKNLVDYYPMNEGSGDYAIDKTQGANAKLIGASWAMPRGYSLHLDIDDHGIELNDLAMNRTKEQDYTLMFWFKTENNGRGVLISNGAGLKTEDNAENIFNIAFEANKLMYRSNGFATEVPGDWSDNQWHHYAMTVNRARNVVNIYVDNALRTTFAADSLGGISGGHPMIGAAQYDISDGKNNVTTIDTRNWLAGNIDELCFFAQALPLTLINTYATKSPKGDEAGLLSYLGFDHQERNQFNEIVMTPYVYSKKIYLDANGNVRYQEDPVTMEPTGTPARDYLFKDDAEKIMTHIVATTAAPVLPNEEVSNLNFSFIGRGNQIMVELDEPAAKLNHRNVYVTVRDVEDRYGNTMASPQTASFYVTSSSLQWVLNKASYTLKYGTGEDPDQELILPFYNSSSSSHTYTIDNCPRWLTLSKYSDAIAPQGIDGVTAVVNKGLNVGTYNEIIYLTDEDGISEPLYLTLTIEGEKPAWADQVDRDLLKYSMSIIGKVYLNDELDTDARDIVGVFDETNVCHGFANISHNTLTDEASVYLTVYDSLATGRKLNFRLWQYNTGREIVLTATPSVTFAKDAILGTNQPVRFDGGESFVQYFNLKRGWNWVSFNILSENLFDLNTLLRSKPWTENDIITDMSSGLTLTYENGNWLTSGSLKNVVISPKNAYAINVQQDCTFPVTGTVIRNKDERTITVNPGWNAIGYTPAVNLTVETALADYFDNAESGDVIKSHTEFAYFTKSGNSGRWQGSLQYMKPGEGYMMLRKGTGEAKFAYPFYELGNNFIENISRSKRRSTAAHALNTMSVSATVVGVEVEDGDALIAYSNGEEVGNAIINTSESDVNYLSIGGNSQAPIWFAIERDGEIIASTSEIMTFKTNAVIGTPNEPTAINFVHTEYEKDGKWYTISGLPLQKKPVLRGIYIFNGKKVVIK